MKPIATENGRPQVQQRVIQTYSLYYTIYLKRRLVATKATKFLPPIVFAPIWVTYPSDLLSLSRRRNQSRADRSYSWQT